MKILIPTDFSKLSKVAVHYAATIAKKLKAELVLLNVIFINAPPRAAVAMKVKTIEDAMADNAKQDSIQLINELKKENKNLNVSYEIIRGYPVEDVVEVYAKHHEIDLVIMGTKGASGLTKVLIGSNAAAVINKSTIPVITVPEHARFNGIKRIVYSSDMHETVPEMQTLIPFARLFGAAIFILHVMPVNSKRKIDIVKIKKDIISKFDFKDVSIHVSINNEIADGIDEFIADVKADMLTMFTHDLTFLEKLFGKSVTREMAFHTGIPLLTIKK